MRLRFNVIKAVLIQNLNLYFNNPAGYVFITLFIVASAVLQFSWGDQFFQNNLADLGPLNQHFPYLLLFFIPVLTMNSWAEEKNQGTDEFLLTLPATDFEITLGKYLALLGTYVATLVFSLSLVVAIASLGSPDWGLIASSYLAYLLIGGTMLSLGMFASMLTRNATIACLMPC